MDTKTFFENFETIANAPGGITRLRELILDLAVRGKLVQRLPDSDWNSTVQLKDVGKMIRGVTYAKAESSKSERSGFVPLLGAANIQHEINYDGLTYVPEGLIKSDQIVSEGDILICMSSGSKHLVGKTAPIQNSPRASFGAFCAVFRISEPANRDYIARFFKSPVYRRAISSASRGIGINNLRIGDVESIELSLPSFNEQSLIVAKVDELMALCDQLELAQQQRDSLRTSARNSAIDSISTASTAEELGAAWKRINQNWTTFADTPESISSLRTLILKSAGQGKLQRNSATPKSGPRASLGELCDIYQPKTISKNELIEDGKYLVYGANGVIGRYDKFNHEFEEVTVTCRGATCGTVNVTAPKSWINGNAMVVRPKVDELTKEFLAVILRGLDYETVITGSAQPQITRQPLAKVLIWIPKLAEQQKIVFQVDRLMSLCDVLESALLKKAELEEQISRAVTSEVAA